MAFRRSSGVLLHPTSLPGGYGIGDLGPAALEFVDLLAVAKQRLWQVLPLGPTGYGDSPYQCFSAFAGNPLLISPDRLIDDGLLTAADVGAAFRRPTDTVDFPAVIAHRESLWPRVLERFDAPGTAPMRERFERFCRTEAHWLTDFALFMAVKAAHGQAPWTSWEPGIAHRDPAAIARWSERCTRDIRQHQLTQFLFFEQWHHIRDACHARSIQIMGDLPIFVAHDSADVWSRQELFRLDADGQPAVVAGVPPDYFSATGQLWGNPHYQWEEIARTGAVPLAAHAGGCHPHRSLPRIRSVLGGLCRISNRRQRSLGEGPWCSALRSGAFGLEAGTTTIRSGESRRHHTGSGVAAATVRPARDGYPAVCLRHRPTSAGLPAA
jgi:4-alpha-glucanotransferase